MCMVGLQIGNADAYSVDLLVNARKRTWAGYEDERVPRPGRA
jgi:hypothetical protein